MDRDGEDPCIVIVWLCCIRAMLGKGGVVRYTIRFRRVLPYGNRTLA